MSWSQQPDDLPRLTPEEIEAAAAWNRQWWLSVLTLGLIPEPEPERELEAGP